MAIDVKVPVLAESVAEATLMNWHRSAGDSIRRGDSLIDIETDKVTLEVAAPSDGVLVEILKGNGESVQSDEVIARIEPGSGADKAAPVAQAPAAAIPAAPAPPPVAPAAVAPAAAAKPEPQPEPRQQALDVDVPAPADEPRLSPAVRSLLAEHGLDAASIAGTGPGGRLTKEDVLNHVGAAAKAAPAATTPPPTPVAATEPPRQEPAARPAQAAGARLSTPPAPVPAAAAPAERAAEPPRKPAPEPAASPEPQQSAPAPAAAPASTRQSSRPEQRVPMTRLRRRTAERLLSAQHENAILTTFNEVNMQPVIGLRNRYKEDFERTHGVRLGFMSFFTKAAVEALKKFPIINASVDGSDIIYHGYFDIGIAVSTPRGLVVPIVRDADTLSLADIEAAIRDFGDRARDSKLTIDELTGGTFTITNGGVFGSLLSTPIINPPQSAILGMHKTQDRPVAENGQVVIRPMMYLALSYDHRIIDGRDAVQFLVTIKEQIEDPTRLLLQV
jgi:2-oxoglutarate dehydrogenase E2 component (dihydrolipoamide succinyltransferase)